MSFKIKVCLVQDANGKQIFKCTTWYPSADLTPAKARKEADRVAVRLEKEQKLTFSQQKVGEEPAPPAPVYTSNAFINEVWVPLFIRDGSNRPATVAMYTNILKAIRLQFKEIPILNCFHNHITFLNLKYGYFSHAEKGMADFSFRHAEMRRLCSLICIMHPALPTSQGKSHDLALAQQKIPAVNEFSLINLIHVRKSRQSLKGNP